VAKKRVARAPMPRVPREEVAAEVGTPVSGVGRAASISDGRPRPDARVLGAEHGSADAAPGGLAAR
jgi:hypothetical protein